MDQLDRRRRTISIAVRVFMVVCLCIFGITKSAPAFDASNSTPETETPEGEPQAIEPVTPPQPRNRLGKLTCTKDRYIQGEQQKGIASWYGNEFHGGITASGKRFNQHANTLAHLTLPMGTKVIVENPHNGKSFSAQVTDCGPFIRGRIADLSKGLAVKLGILEKGTGEVIIHVL